jgi:hypothetical protein
MNLIKAEARKVHCIPKKSKASVIPALLLLKSMAIFKLIIPQIVPRIKF